MGSLGHLPKAGDAIDRYTVLAELAHGGMAAVFVVGRQQGSFDKLFAMKVMLPHLASEQRFVDMFLDEARIAAKVEHPNVVQVFDVGEVRKTPYLVMEYLRGQPLSALNRRVQLPPAALLEILAEAADGLHAAHETRDRHGDPLQIVHRDVSPQNIHIGYEGSVRVVDFGIAAAKGRITKTQTGEVKGKFGYAAPEQLETGASFDRRLDLWALGVVAWEMLAAERLFRGDSDMDTMFNILHKPVPSLAERVPDLPASVDEVIQSCLERVPDLRPKNARLIAERFREGARELGTFGQGALAALVTDAFVDERKVEEERIAAAHSLSRAAIPEDESSSNGAVFYGSQAPAPATATANTGRWIGLGALLALLAAAAYALSPSLQGSRPTSTARETQAAAPQVAAETPDETRVSAETATPVPIREAEGEPQTAPAKIPPAATGDDPPSMGARRRRTRRRVPMSAMSAPAPTRNPELMDLPL